MKEVYQTCDSRTCKYEGTVHHIIDDKIICSKCKKETKLTITNDIKRKKNK
jgi:hypothetical protein